MSLQADILRTEIAKLKQERMCESVADKLARYWCALQALSDAEPAEESVTVSAHDEPLQAVQSNTGAWKSLVCGKDMQAVADIMDKHFEVLAAIAPKHYAAVISALDKI